MGKGMAGRREKDGPCADAVGEGKRGQRPQGLKVCQREPSSGVRSMHPRVGGGADACSPPPHPHHNVPLFLPTSLYLEQPLSALYPAPSSSCPTTPPSLRNTSLQIPFLSYTGLVSCSVLSHSLEEMLKIKSPSEVSRSSQAK